MADDTKDGELDRSRVQAPEACALDRDAAPSSAGVASHVHAVTATENARAAPEPVARSRTRTFDTSDNEVARALREQYTPQARSYLRRFAEHRVHMMRANGRPCPPPKEYAVELVHDAYVDTLIGERAWDHERVSLVEHLRGVITSRTSNEIKTGRKYTSLEAPIAANENDDATDEPVTLADRLHASSGDLTALRVAALLTRTCAELRAATDDRDCNRILHQWENGIVEREDVMLLTELDATAYRRARDRLFYLADNLPDELRQLVRDYLRSAS